MRKIIAIILTLMLVASLTISASAANIVPIGKTISFKMPTIKTVDVSYSSVYGSSKTAIQSNVLNNLYKTYPINIKIG